MEGFQINYTDLSDLFWEYKRKIENGRVSDKLYGSQRSVLGI